MDGWTDEWMPLHHFALCLSFLLCVYARCRLQDINGNCHYVVGFMDLKGKKGICICPLRVGANWVWTPEGTEVLIRLIDVDGWMVRHIN